MTKTIVENERDDARRQLIKTLGMTSSMAASVYLSKTWTRPVVESVILPAHAQISIGSNSCTVNPGLALTCSDTTLSVIIQYYRIVSAGDGCTLELTDESNEGEGVFWAGVFSDIAGDNQFQAELNYNNSASRDFLNLNIGSCSLISDEQGTLRVEAMDITGSNLYEVTAPYEFDSTAQTVSMGAITVTRL